MIPKWGSRCVRATISNSKELKLFAELELELETQNFVGLELELELQYI